MKSIVRYQSRNGNTKAVATVIAQNIGVEAHSIDHPVTDYVDVLLVGGGVYAGKMDKSLRTFLDSLSPDKIGKIIAFSTSGTQNNTLLQIKEHAEKKGIPVSSHELLVKMYLHGHSILGQSGGKLTSKHIEKINDFLTDIKGE